MSNLSPSEKLTHALGDIYDEGAFIPDLVALNILTQETISFVPDRIVPVVLNARFDNPRLIIGAGFSENERRGYPSESFSPHNNLRTGEKEELHSAYIIGGHGTNGDLEKSLFWESYRLQPSDMQRFLAERYSFSEIYFGRVAEWPSDNPEQLPFRITDAMREIMGWRYSYGTLLSHIEIMSCVEVSLLNSTNGTRSLGQNEVIRRAGVYLNRAEKNFVD